MYILHSYLPLCQIEQSAVGGNMQRHIDKVVKQYKSTFKQAAV